MTTNRIDRVLLAFAIYGLNEKVAVVVCLVGVHIGLFTLVFATESPWWMAAGMIVWLALVVPCLAAFLYLGRLQRKARRR